MKKKLLIVGAGLTGLGIAYLLREQCEFKKLDHTRTK